MTVENYHLKWDSYHTHLNSSVATLYKNEKYADVVLYSSNNASSITNANHIPTVGISAHKFILSSCSQYFSTIFETSPVTNHGIFYIVLPPDLSHRAIQILVQYMYMGEATVSNDILSEVLRGGEILKIRGLCRANTTTTTTTTTTNNSSIGGGSGSGGSALSRLNGGTTSVRYLIEQQQQQHLRGLGASVLPKDSPVIMKSPKPLSLLTTIISNGILKNSNGKSISTTGNGASNSGSNICSGSSVGVGVGVGVGIGGITINKEVAIDPEDKCCYTTEGVATKKPTLMDSPLICKEIGCNNCTLSMDNQQQLHQSRNSHLTSDRCQNNEPLPLALPLSTVERNTYHLDQHQHHHNHHHLQQLRHFEPDHNTQEYEHDIFSRVNQSTECSDGIQDYPPLTDNYKIFTNSTQQQSMDDNINCRSVSPLEKFTNIKQEPREWLASPVLPPPPPPLCTSQIVTTAATTTTAIETGPSGATNNGSRSQLQHKVLDFELNDIKTETVLNSSSSTSTSNSYTSNPEEHCRTNVLSSSVLSQQLQSQPQTSSSSLSLSSSCINDYEHYLTCDMCNETFEDLSSLLRHSDALHATAPSACSPAYNLSIINHNNNNNNNNNNNISNHNDNSKHSSNNLNENKTVSTLTKSFVPKKRRRISESNLAEPVSLQCDLCNTSFETAAEWVRHMNCQHTEIELAIFNSKKDKEHKMLESN